ncbi:hypothetical protein BL253_03495 [Pseudofrankia asymbiotica]|uniref:Uncharacterized protein n=1 Tax=Pseudofrankia asymbiotica TaxID=1834516 RepID=A0A1V2II67_9ACTN|nr:hypothetical protein BL253_03495 [Pseudofrankia asymbiotica]
MASGRRPMTSAAGPSATPAVTAEAAGRLGRVGGGGWSRAGAGWPITPATPSIAGHGCAGQTVQSELDSLD